MGNVKRPGGKKRKPRKQTGRKPRKQTAKKRKPRKQTGKKRKSRKQTGGRGRYDFLNKPGRFDFIQDVFS